MRTLLADFLTVSESFFVSVRVGNVPTTEAVESVLRLLDGLIVEYHESDHLPKELVGVMLDMSTALYSAADTHAEPLRSQLYSQFDTITDKMRDLCC